MPVLSSGQKVPALFLTGNNVFPGNLIRNKLQNEQSGRRYLQPFSGKLPLSKKKRPVKAPVIFQKNAPAMSVIHVRFCLLCYNSHSYLLLADLR